MLWKVSDESVNSYGIRVLTSGGDFSQFEKNPLMLYDHDEFNYFPIGTWKDLQKKDNGELVAEPVFDDEDEFALSVKKKVDKGIIKMASLGIIPLEWSDDPELMLAGQVSVTITKWILREISVTPFGSNKNAFKMYDKQGNVINLNDNTTFFKTNNNNKKMSESKNTLLVMLAAGLNLPDKISENELVREVLNLRNQNQQLTEKVKILEGEKKDTEKALELKEKERVIDEAVQAKKITMKQKPVYMKLELNDVKEILDGMPAPEDLSNIGNGDGGDKDKERKSWTFNDWSKNDPDGLSKIKKNDPERYKMLFNQEFKKEPEL